MKQTTELQFSSIIDDLRRLLSNLPPAEASEFSLDLGNFKFDREEANAIEPMILSDDDAEI